MASIVKIPSYANANDMDFLAFSFNGKHSWDDFKIYRVISGDRYNEELSPPLNDKTAEVEGMDGSYFFSTTHKPKVFNIEFAFENLPETKFKEMKKWLNGKEIGDLWFDESPYKVYTAKVTSQPTIKYIPFDKKIVNDGRLYNGEGSVQFTAYWPYAHTPDKLQIKNGGNWTDITESAKSSSAYSGRFANLNDWSYASGLTSNTGKCTGENPGDLPTHFVLTYPDEISTDLTFTVGEVSITVKGSNTTKYTNFTWNSKTGIVSAKTNDTDGTKSAAPIPYTGNSLGTIPVGGTTTITIKQNANWTNGDYKVEDSSWKKYNESEWTTTSTIWPALSYHYWYY